MVACTYCGAEFPDARPYLHCTKQDCVDTWKLERRNDMSVVLIPKSGFTLAYRDDSTATAATNRH